VLYTVAGVLAAVLVLLVSVNVITSARRKKRLAQAIDTIQVEPEYRARDHRGTRKARKEKAEKPGREKKEKKNVKQEDELGDFNLDEELTDEEAVRIQEEARAKQPAREEGRRRRGMQEREVPDDRTLRVMPVEDRPEFVAQEPVDDSQTRIFGKLDTQEAIGEEMTLEQPITEPQAEAADDPTIRLSGEQVSEIRKGESRRANRKEKKAPKELKKSKKSLFGFSRVKDEVDDFIDDEFDELDGDEDDFIE